MVSIKFQKINDLKNLPLILPLFNEAEVCQNEKEAESTYEEITYERQKKHRSRTDNMKDLPVETVMHRLSPSEQVCSCRNGELHEMKTEIRRELKVIPAEVKVVEHHRSMYSCRSCERHGTETPLKYAPIPAPFFQKAWLRRPQSLTSSRRSPYKAFPCIGKKLNGSITFAKNEVSQSWRLFSHGFKPINPK
ncbi:IS66 family transposase zinc-finger binding domain-containing protein [Salipaludibacillus sp. CF4.18]|uniref:IS66 family transposase zinc-finger binding domain-containing protein n=1 Tax=Salipaludibacillus sp. CF4.18 TaxID=3373081 RepID=UPI003EE5370F